WPEISRIERVRRTCYSRISREDDPTGHAGPHDRLFGRPKGAGSQQTVIHRHEDVVPQPEGHPEMGREGKGVFNEPGELSGSVRPCRIPSDLKKECRFSEEQVRKGISRSRAGKEIAPHECRRRLYIDLNGACTTAGRDQMTAARETPDVFEHEHIIHMTRVI